MEAHNATTTELVSDYKTYRHQYAIYSREDDGIDYATKAMEKAHPFSEVAMFTTVRSL